MHPLATKRLLILSKAFVLAGSIGTFSAVHADTLWQPVDPTAPGLLFTDGVNWDTGFAPTDTDIATINDGSTANVVDGDAISILQLQLDVGTILQTGGTFATPDGVQNFNIGTVLPVNPGDFGHLYRERSFGDHGGCHRIGQKSRNGIDVDDGHFHLRKRHGRHLVGAMAPAAWEVSLFPAAHIGMSMAMRLSTVAAGELPR